MFMCKQGLAVMQSLTVENNLDWPLSGWYCIDSMLLQQERYYEQDRIENCLPYLTSGCLIDFLVS